MMLLLRRDEEAQNLRNYIKNQSASIRLRVFMRNLTITKSFEC